MTDEREERTENSTAITVTVKGGAGFEAPWIVLRADTPGEMMALIGQVGDMGVDMAVRVLSQRFRAVATGTPEQAAQAALGGEVIIDEPAPPPPPQPQPGGFAPPPGYGPPPNLNPPCKTCGGPTVFKQDTKANPPAWKGYFCQNAPRGVKHDVNWVR
jgi:hypothetical protein